MVMLYIIFPLGLSAFPKDKDWGWMTLRPSSRAWREWRKQEGKSEAWWQQKPEAKPNLTKTTKPSLLWASVLVSLVKIISKNLNEGSGLSHCEGGQPRNLSGDPRLSKFPYSDSFLPHCCPTYVRARCRCSDMIIASPEGACSRTLKK